MERADLPLFSALRALREFEKRHLPFLQTVEDYDLMLEIGFRQAAGRPINLKEVMLLGIASVPTVQRRLRRLRELGVLKPQRCAHDGRAVELLLAPEVVETIGRCEPLLRPAAAADASNRGAASAPAPEPARENAARRRGKAPGRETGAPAGPGAPRDP